MSSYSILQTIIMVSMVLLLLDYFFIIIYYRKNKELINITSNVKIFMLAHMLMIFVLTYFSTRYILNYTDTFYNYILYFTLFIVVIELLLYPIFVYKCYYIKDNVIYKKGFNKITTINSNDISKWTGYYYKKHLIIKLKDNTTFTFEKGLINLDKLVLYLEENKKKRVDTL